MKPNMRRTFVVGFSLALPLVCQAQDGPAFLINGHGNHDCERFNAWKEVSSASQDPYLQWMLGFVTGVGAVRVRLASDTASEMWTTVRKHCEAQPEQAFSTAVGRMVEDLHRRSTEGDRFVLHGVGVQTCAEYLLELDAAHGANAQWPAGYATGVGSAGIALGQLRGNAVADSVQQYCEAAPEAQVATATARVIDKGGGEH
jgi:hypothetical protein